MTSHDMWHAKTNHLSKYPRKRYQPPVIVARTHRRTKRHTDIWCNQNSSKLQLYKGSVSRNTTGMYTSSWPISNTHWYKNQPSDTMPSVRQHQSLPAMSSMPAMRKSKTQPEMDLLSRARAKVDETLARRANMSTPGLTSNKVNKQYTHIIFSMVIVTRWAVYERTFAWPQAIWQYAKYICGQYINRMS